MTETPKAARVGVSPRLRFEVFKRDKFTCQYCGATAPSVVLHVDHIKPVAAGGTNDILNLLTSCSTCNGGKGAIQLSDGSAVEKQRLQMEELEDRRQQIEMMLQWRDELQNVSKDLVKGIADRIEQRTGTRPNESGEAHLRRWLKGYGATDVMRGVDEAFDTYAEFVGDQVSLDSWEKAFSKIPGVINTLRQQATKPYIRRLFYIQGIVRNRIRASYCECFAYLEHVHLAGESLDDLEIVAKRIRSIEELYAYYARWLEDLGRPF